MQKEAQMDKFDVHWNGYQFFIVFFKNMLAYQQSFSKIILFLLFLTTEIILGRYIFVWHKGVILSFTGNFASLIAKKDA